MRGLILAYHSQNCGGHDYSSNDHLAFAHDLQTVLQRGLPIISLLEIATKLAAGKAAQLPERFIALSCDDGTLLDWHDYQHPVFGMQRSFANILREQLSAGEHAQRGLLTAFVIASPAARRAIDAGCYDGIPLSDDDWWDEAAAEGLLAIGNHSWDHVHPVLPEYLLDASTAGNFFSIDNHAKAEIQVKNASTFIDQRLAASGQRTALFAYPFGQASDYLALQYLPQQQAAHGIVGAFTTEQQYVVADTPVYRIPRMVHGDAWHTPEQFETLLQHLLV